MEGVALLSTLNEQRTMDIHNLNVTFHAPDPYRQSFQSIKSCKPFFPASSTPSSYDDRTIDDVSPQPVNQEAEALESRVIDIQNYLSTKQCETDGLSATVAAHRRALDVQHVCAALPTATYNPQNHLQDSMEALQVHLGHALQEGRHAAQRRRVALTETAAMLHAISNTTLEYALTR